MVESSVTDRFARALFLLAVVAALAGGGFVYGVLAHKEGLFPVPQLQAVKQLVADGDILSGAYKKHLQPARGTTSGVVVNARPDDGAQILLAGFFDRQNQIRLLSRDGTVIHKWPLDYFAHFPDPESRPCDRPSSLDVDTHGVQLNGKGELVFNYEYCGTVKLDACGNVLWTINKPTHHSIVPAEAGGYWLLGRLHWQASEQPDRFPPFSSAGGDIRMKQDTIMRISESGDILEEVSLPKIMVDNGMAALLTANGLSFTSTHMLDDEIVHANKVAELPSHLADAFPLFAAGDLAISLRSYNLVMVIEPGTWRVKWHQTGPWIRQHDPEFRDDGRISVFNNNAYRTAYRNDQTDLEHAFSTNIIAIDPVSRDTEVLFGEKPGQEMLSVIRGQHEVLEDDGILITEFDAGRILEVNENRDIVWEYINRYDENHVGELTNARIYPEGYFQRSGTQCAE